MRKGVLLAMLAGVLAAGLVLLVWTATREEYRMPSASMEPTIRAGALLVVDTSAYRGRAPMVGDVVVFRTPFAEDELQVKRIAAIGPAEVNLLPDGALVVDQESAPRRRIDDRTFEEAFGSRRHRIRWDDDRPPGGYPPGPWPVFDGKLFLLGDNRQNSHDSRHWGPIDRAAIVGRVTHVYSAGGGAPRGVD